MAYLDLAERFDTTILAHQSASAIPGAADWPHLSISEREVVLSRLDREAVMLARIDRKASLKPVAGLRRLAGVVFGTKQSNALADPRLEALRRFAVAVAYDTENSIAREQRHLKELGFSDRQIARAADLASTHKRARSQGLSMQLAFFLLIAAACLFVDRHLQSGIMSLVTVAMPAMPVWALIAPRQ